MKMLVFKLVKIAKLALRLKQTLVPVHGNQSGSTLLIVAVGIAIVTAVAMAYANMYASVRKVQAKVDFLNAVAQIQLTLANTANDANSWARTTSDSTNNSSMNCIQNQNCTVAVNATGFVLWPAGTTSFTNLSDAVYDGTNASSGYTLTGQPCTTFSTSGNRQCPIHVNLTWATPGCGPAPCQAPITVAAEILFRPGAGSAVGDINESHTTLSFTQNSSTSGDPCATPVPPSEVATCASPNYSNDTLICTSTGFRCGQVYY